MREYMMDFIETFTNKEIAQAIREGILTLSDVEVALRRRMLWIRQ
jgi:hypothetical protein